MQRCRRRSCELRRFSTGAVFDGCERPCDHAGRLFSALDRQQLLGDSAPVSFSEFANSSSGACAHTRLKQQQHRRLFQEFPFLFWHMRKQRRLRSWWRHEQQSIAAALATFTHHSEQRQKTARAGEEGSSCSTLRSSGSTSPPAGALQPVRRAQRDSATPVWVSHQGRKSGSSGTPWSSLPTQIHDAPVPQVFRLLDIAVPVQVIDVPKIPQDRIPQRSASRSPQLAEQFVDGGGTWQGRSGRSAGGSWSHGTPSGPLRKDSPPTQGGVQTLGSAAVPTWRRRWLTSL